MADSVNSRLCGLFQLCKICLAATDLLLLLTEKNKTNKSSLFHSLTSLFTFSVQNKDLDLCPTLTYDYYRQLLPWQDHQIIAFSYSFIIENTVQVPVANK